jgi:tetrahydromethanopterin S-methyltransferase subunit G
MNELELFKRLAAIERRLTRVEHQNQEFDQILDPSGWIAEAFDAQQKQFDNLEGKIDLILGHLTRRS